MADEHDWTKSNLMFGSAGMAASGMMPSRKCEPEAEEEKPPPLLPEEELEEVMDHGPFELDLSETEEEEVAVESPGDEEEVEEIETEYPRLVVLPEPPAPEIVEPKGYGINAKAQGLFSDLRVAILSCGDRVIAGADWDRIFEGVSGMNIVGVSDPFPESLKSLCEVYGVGGGYLNFSELLSRTKPHLAVIPQLGTGSRYDVIKSCLMAGTHVLVAAPFTRNLLEADELIALAIRRGLKISVAYPLRLDPNVVQFHDSYPQLIGDLVEIQIHGEMDETSGGQDLLLHGGPMFDLARMFAGAPKWCSAMITKDGKRATRDDLTIEEEGSWGPLIGDRVDAQILMDSDVLVKFSSNSKLRRVMGGWGMEFIGTHGRMRLLGGGQPTLSLMRNPGPLDPDAEEHWQIWPEHRSPYHVEVDGMTGADAANRLVAADWLEAISLDEEPETSGRRAMEVLEMVHGVFQSALSAKREYFPLANRHHPLEIHEVLFRKTA